MLVAHIVFRFDYGGLENGVVNVINGLPDEDYRHVVIALTVATEFTGRLRDGVSVYSLGKRAGKDIGIYWRLFKILRRISPDIVHTRNIGTMECAMIAFFAGVPFRIHGEHGWDIFDPDGTKRKYRFIRKLLHPFIHRIVTVSAHLKDWLISSVDIPERKIQHICNGVDTEAFHPLTGNECKAESGDIVIGSVTRFATIKDPINLVEAYIRLRSRGMQARLIMIGDGELRESARHLLQVADLESTSWLPGSRDDVAEQLRSMDVFVLASLREGISNTILEAMASGLPIVATDTGGNPELVEDGVNGILVPAGDRDALAEAIAAYLLDPNRRITHGRASRDRAASLFSVTKMVNSYRELYGRVVRSQAG